MKSKLFICYRIHLMVLFVTFIVTDDTFANAKTCSQIFNQTNESIKLSAPELYNYSQEIVLFRAQTVEIRNLEKLHSYLNLDNYKGSRWIHRERLGKIQDLISSQGLRGLALHQLGQATSERLTLSTTQDLAQITHIERYGRNDIAAKLGEQPTIRVLAEIHPDPKTEAVLFLRNFVDRDSVNETGLFDSPKNVQWYIITGHRDEVKIYKIKQKDHFNIKMSWLSNMLIKEKDKISLEKTTEEMDKLLMQMELSNVVSRDINLELSAKLNYYSTAIDMGKRQDQNRKWQYSNDLQRVVEILNPYMNEANRRPDMRVREALKLTKEKLRRRLLTQENYQSIESKLAIEMIKNWISD